MPAQTVMRNVLKNAADENAGDYFQNIEKWRAEKRISILKQFKELPDSVRTSLVANADNELKTDWASLHASRFLDFKLNGNRSKYEAEVMARKNKLTRLVLAELAARSGKYIPHIIDGLWLMLEESSWAYPAHMAVGNISTQGLPDPNEDIIDLGAGESGALVAWIKFLLTDELDAVSPAILKRVDWELNKRIFQPYLKQDFRWMGFGSQAVNNWNIWINKNVLLSSLLTLEDKNIRDSVINKTIKSVDVFINNYPEDGGCDEGSSYWGHAGGKLIGYVSQLQEASFNKLNFSSSKLIHNIGRYILYSHIGGNYFVNHGDGAARVYPPAGEIFSYGKLFNDTQLKQFSSYINNTITSQKKPWFNASNLTDFLSVLSLHREMQNTEPQAAYLKWTWLPDLQQLFLRANEGESKGLFFFTSGGNNGESHNHNDVGNFTIYADGNPLIIDVGVGTYTKETFSADRYKTWYMQSQWHNTPTINGIQQKEGKQYAASGVVYDNKNPDKSSLSMDIASAYPAEAMVKSWIRKWEFNSKRSEIKLRETYDLAAFVKPADIHFITVASVEEIRPGELLLSTQKSAIKMYFNPDQFELLTEYKKLEDSKIKGMWGQTLNRITLRSKANSLKGFYDFTFISE